MNTSQDAQAPSNGANVNTLTSTNPPQAAKAPANDTNVNTLTELNPPSTGQTNWGRLFELLCVVFCAASVTLLLMGFKNPVYWIVALGLLVIASLPYKLAIDTAVNEVAKQDDHKSKLRYKVNWERLDTLESVGVPKDVRGTLKSLLNEKPLNAEEFLKKATLNLTWERIKPWRETILTYTRDDAPVVTPTSNGSQSPTNGAAAKN